MKVRYFSTLRDKQIDCALKWKYSQIFRENVEDTSKKIEIYRCYFNEKQHFFEKNIHLNLIKQTLSGHRL